MAIGMSAALALGLSACQEEERDFVLVDDYTDQLVGTWQVQELMIVDLNVAESSPDRMMDVTTFAPFTGVTLQLSPPPAKEFTFNLNGTPLDLPTQGTWYAASPGLPSAIVLRSGDRNVRLAIQEDIVPSMTTLPADLTFQTNKSSECLDDYIAYRMKVSKQ